MTSIRAILAATATLGLLAGCTAGTGGGPGGDRLSRAERNRPLPGSPRADPGRVAATDIAFARAARDEGQWTAFREYAAPAAQLHGDSGAFEAAAWLAARADPAEPVRWAPTAVWSSCDGSLAVSFGRSRDPEGIVGSYVTVWERQARGEYRWIYNTGTPDDPQPPPPPPELTPDPDTIIVAAMDAIDARTADCPAALAAAPAPTADAEAMRWAVDGTLGWRSTHLGAGQWQVELQWLRGGSWQQALDFTAPDSGD